MILKICPVVGATSLGPERGPERALLPDDPTVSIDDFIRCPPGIEAPSILKPTLLRWLRFQADPARRSHRGGRVAHTGKFFERYRVVDRFFNKVV
jgi:hypothetical protein